MTQFLKRSEPPMLVREKVRIGDLLVQRGVVTREQLDIALRLQMVQSPRAPIGKILVERGFATAGQVARCLATHVGCPFVDVEPALVREEALRALPQQFIEQHNILPLSVSEGWLTIALEHFNDPFLLAEIARRSGLQVQPVAADPELIRATRTAALSSAGAPPTSLIGFTDGP